MRKILGGVPFSVRVDRKITVDLDSGDVLKFSMRLRTPLKTLKILCCLRFY